VAFEVVEKALGAWQRRD